MSVSCLGSRQVIVFGPVFCQTVIVVTNRPYFTQTVFYTDSGVRLFNPSEWPCLLCPYQY
jgi:hypothetical protein